MVSPASSRLDAFSPDNFHEVYSPTLGVLFSPRFQDRPGAYVEPLWVGNSNKPGLLHPEPLPRGDLDPIARLATLPDHTSFYAQITMEAADDPAVLEAMQRARSSLNCADVPGVRNCDLRALTHQEGAMTRTHSRENALMRRQISTLALMAALVAVAFVSLPSEAFAQYGHYYGHGYGYGYSYGHGYGGYGPYGYGAYRSNDGDVRIEVGPKYLRDEAQVYVNEAHVGDVDDFDGYFQRLSLTPGEYDVEIRLAGYQTLKTRVFVRRGSTYTIRESLKPVATN